MPGSEADGEHVDQQQEMMETLRSLVLRQGQLEERMAATVPEERASPALAGNKMESEPVGICQPLVLYA